MFQHARLLTATLLAAAGLIVAPATANAGGPTCQDTYTFGAGGFEINAHGTGQSSTYIPADQPVGYNSVDLVAGVAELDRLFHDYRNRCPGTHLKMLGHSGGAAVVHMWVSQHTDEPNATAILVSDPKRVAGPGSAGIAANPLAIPADWIGIFRGAAGADANFGAFPVLTICNAGDWVCNESAGLRGYLTTGVHGRYNLNPHAYPNYARGVWFPPVY
ncbi:cutinase family protein [Nocardia sp. NPDC058640]|uniref:cutinase family protein n=1 Tax=Nocardia sp. NPDC058640 TaxID=3346571 RepID=UPI00364F35C5